MYLDQVFLEICNVQSKVFIVYKIVKNKALTADRYSVKTIDAVSIWMGDRQ